MGKGEDGSGKDVISNFGWGRKTAVRIVNSRGVRAVRENLNAAPLWSRMGTAYESVIRFIERGYRIAILGEWKESERDTNGSLRSEDHGAACGPYDRIRRALTLDVGLVTWWNKERVTFSCFFSPSSEVL